MYWKIQNGKIHTKRLEINVAHHCNLTCRGCSHLSPRLPRFFISPDQLYKDLSELSRYCRPERIGLVGGEPLLHPDLLDVVKAVKNSGISNHIAVVTNGVLLHKMTDQFWQSVDKVVVSLYPSHPMKVDDLTVFQKHAKNNAAHLILKYQDNFREFFSELGTQNDSLIRQIYSTCRIPREGGCHTLYQGHYYKCPQALFIPFVFNDRFDFSRVKDSVKIADNNSFAEELAKYLSSEEPLEACRYCLGSVGKRFTPEQVPRKGTCRRTTTEELIDWKLLEKLERGKGLPVSGWLQKILPVIGNLSEMLPASIRLSPTLRRGIRILKESARRFIK